MPSIDSTGNARGDQRRQIAEKSNRRLEIEKRRLADLHHSGVQDGGKDGQQGATRTTGLDGEPKQDQHQTNRDIAVSSVQPEKAIQLAGGLYGGPVTTHQAQSGPEGARGAWQARRGAKGAKGGVAVHNKAEWAGDPL